MVGVSVVAGNAQGRVVSKDGGVKVLPNAGNVFHASDTVRLYRMFIIIE